MSPSRVRDVTIEYRPKGGAWRVVRLDPADYFEASGPGPISDDAIERFDRAVDYLDLDPSQVEITRLTLVDRDGEAWDAVTETLWDGGQSRLIERGTPGRPPWLVIVDARVGPELRQVMRFERDPTDGASRMVHASTYRVGGQNEEDQ